jgi:hypothetical protein
MKKNTYDAGIVGEKEFKEWVKENNNYIYRTISTYKTEDIVLQELRLTTGETVLFTVYSEKLLAETPF